MKVVVAIDSLKGSLTSMEAGEAIEEGIHLVDPTIEVVVKPLADGGEGTVAALVNGLHGKLKQVQVTGPLKEKIDSQYGIIEDKQLAIMEMASVAGITLVPEEKRNPYYTTTYGLGEMIKDAIDNGCRNFIIGIGGSATNDGGIGMLQALGFDLLDHNNQPISLGAIGLKDLVKIDDQNVISELSECQFNIACDVINPLCGKNGASYIFGPQKGANFEMVVELDNWLDHFSKIVKNKYPDSDPNYPGAGAAGGLGFAFLTFTNAKLESGIKLVLEAIDLASELQDANLVITGEGCLDYQTAMGKAPIGVSKLAKQYCKPVIALAGSVTPEARACNQAGIDAYFPIVRKLTTLQEAMNKENAWNNMVETVEQIFRLLKIKIGEK